MADDLSTNSQTIHVYYGNSTVATTHNNLDLDLFQLREYDLYSGSNPEYTFSKYSSSVLEVSSTETDMGRGFTFIIAPKSYLDGKKLSIYWRVYWTYSSIRTLGRVYVVDNAHLRSKTTEEFQDNDGTNHPVVDYTNTVALEIDSQGLGWTPWTASTSSVLDLSTFTSDYVTILIEAIDGWSGQTPILQVDYLKILDSSNNVLKTFDFTESVKMEQTGTYRDYGLYRKYVSPEPSHGSWGNEEQAFFQLINYELINLASIVSLSLSREFFETIFEELNLVEFRNLLSRIEKFESLLLSKQVQKRIHTSKTEVLLLSSTLLKMLTLNLFGTLNIFEILIIEKLAKFLFLKGESLSLSDLSSPSRFLFESVFLSDLPIKLFLNKYLLETLTLFSQSLRYIIGFKVIRLTVNLLLQKLGVNLLAKKLITKLTKTKTEVKLLSDIE